MNNNILAADSAYFFGAGNSSSFFVNANPTQQKNGQPVRDDDDGAAAPILKRQNQKSKNTHQNRNIDSDHQQQQQIFETDLILTKFPTSQDPEGTRGFKPSFFTVNKNLLDKTYSADSSSTLLEGNEDGAVAAFSSLSCSPSKFFDISVERNLNTGSERVPTIVKLKTKFLTSSSENQILSKNFSLDSSLADTKQNNNNSSSTQLDVGVHNQYPNDVDVLAIPLQLLLQNTNLSAVYDDMTNNNQAGNTDKNNNHNNNHNQSHSFQWPLITFGRAIKSNVLTIKATDENTNLTVNFSRTHFALLCLPNFGWCIFDLGSVNAVFVNGFRVPSLSPVGFKKVNSSSSSSSSAVLAIRLRHLDTLQLGAGKRILKLIFPSIFFNYNYFVY
jgi:hypothetical protein